MTVETWIEFGRGPLFRLAFSLMVLGLLRIFFLTLAGMAESYRRNMDRIVPWGEVAKQTAAGCCRPAASGAAGRSMAPFP